jgi:alkanesulfonate monooxygenase SsuD/methylene tetrahydromethanopterin reductase-like flavin-dependent oxidoreductase (luciferase family)
MRIGVSLAQVGRLADPAAVRSAATCAEAVGYSSLWVFDRLDALGSPGAGRPAPTAAPVPAQGTPTLDPVAVLTYAAACTTRIRLGTSVLVVPWYRPALLARSLTTLDVLSDGRLTIGLGLGWSLDDHAAEGVPHDQLGTRLEHALDVLDLAGDRPRPPVLLAAYTPSGLDRIARRADGWNPSGLPIDQLAATWASVRDQAAAYGRDPDRLDLVVRANIRLTERPVEGTDRAGYHGSLEQVVADLDATRRAGAHEVILGLHGDLTLDQILAGYARIAEAVDMPVPA